MERDRDGDSILGILTMDGKAALPRIHADRRERDYSFLAGDAIVVTQGKLSLREFDIPLDAMEQFLDRLHCPASRPAATSWQLSAVSYQSSVISWASHQEIVSAASSQLTADS
jgi:hypothetical protein